VLGAGEALLETLRSFRSLLEREHLAQAASAPGLPHAPRSLSLLVLTILHFLLFLVIVWIGVRFARRRRNVPTLFIALSLFNLAAVGCLYALGRSHSLAPREFGAVGGAVLWVSYFLLSDRVKRTFLL
jgi:hypothetical protein